ncbi:hypothetical protein A5886_000864 [Enterococcus sp. 8G7_MSG3316]|uniref:cysteine-S-conjugate beta-lyase n=1 Tax=Candidatus Enterococcus testudinis TaxID=1834191 RepID=A0A242A418_9ENTE|nr:MalY/PatB family protein [Enterococcus sp. 8G7_MSG3316]OTN75788.1 hypothetical protein A5886_000864 [Enterococcus sp. 8G7_MSG3316]
MTTDTFIAACAKDRTQTDSLKWDLVDQRFGGKDLLPLWVADMDFAVPEAATEALHRRVEQGAFGYSIVPADYAAAYQGWQARHWQTQVDETWLRFSTGVVQSLYDLLHCFTKVGDAILIQPPVYYPFFDSIKDTKRRIIEAPLQKIDDTYRIDFAAFERKIQTEAVKLFLFCSPHNPAGRVWRFDEVQRLLAICQKYHVLVIADEIHADLILPGNQFVSAVTVAESIGFQDLIIVNSPSKTFNLAGLLLSHVWLPSEELRDRYDAWASQYKQTEVNIFGLTAAKAAYQHGDQWLAEVLTVIQENADYIAQRLQLEVPEARIAPLEGTYLLWIDLSSLEVPNLKTVVQDSAGLAVDYGAWFSQDYDGFIRLNLATTPTIIETALDRLIEAINTYKAQQHFEEDTHDN